MSTDTAVAVRPVEALLQQGPEGLVPFLDGSSLTADESTVFLDVPGLTPGQLARAGVPYDRYQLRGVIQGLGREGRHIVLPGRLADAETDALELIEAIRELIRYSTRFPGRITLQPPSEQPLVATDPWVVTALSADDLVQTERDHSETLTRLRALWLARWQGLEEGSEEHVFGERLLRLLDDMPRRACFEMLHDSWMGETPHWPYGAPSKPFGLERATELFGDRAKWVKAFRQYSFSGMRRMVVIPTWQCELRCSYCYIPKQDGRVMAPRTYERGIDMLLTTEQDEVMLQFFGGEAMLEYDNVRHAITYATRRAKEEGKGIRFIVSSNGWSLTRERLDWLAAHDVRLELSLDGDEWTQTRYRPSRWRGESSYEHSIATVARDILDSGIEHYVIMVVHPTNVDNLAHNFFHIADLGFRRIQINNMLGRVWKPHELKSWAEQLFAIGRELERRWAAGEALEFINMRNKPMAMRLNGEVTIDHDGTIYGGNAFLHETEHKDLFVVGHLDDLTNIDRYWIDATDNNFLLDWSYKPKVTANNVEVGKVLASFCSYMSKKGYDADGPKAAPRPPGAPPEGVQTPA